MCLRRITSTIGAAYSNVNVGGLFGVSYWINRNFGFQGEFGEHEWGTESQTTPINIGTQGNNDGFATFQGGLIGRVPMGKLTRRAHALYRRSAGSWPGTQSLHMGLCRDLRR